MSKHLVIEKVGSKVLLTIEVDITRTAEAYILNQKLQDPITIECNQAGHNKVVVTMSKETFINCIERYKYNHYLVSNHEK